VSLAYNAGAKNTRDAVASYIKAGNLKEIPNAIKGHLPTENIGKTKVNLSKRRQNEAQLFEEGLKEREQQSR
jgi:GH24 family phage-related lysozyme (muramidase)